MRIENLVGVVFSEKEVIEGLLCLLDGARNDLLQTDPKWERISQIIEHAEKTHACLDYADGEYHLVLDGVCSKEEV